MPPPIPVQILPHAAEWAELAREEGARLLAAADGRLTGVQHIGSTAVPGLAAKPVIDLMPVAEEPTALDECREVLAALGYQWWGELGIPGRRYCTRDDAAGRRVVQLHCFIRGSQHVIRHLAFRDYLRADAAVAAEYAAEKRRCAALHPGDSHAYAECKAAWVHRVEAEALRWTALRAGSGQAAE